MAIAVLRRKRLYSGTLGTTANTVIVTCGAAPADGSAKESVRMTLCNKSGAAVTANVGVDGGAGLLAYVVQALSIAAGDTFFCDVTMDFMGTEKIQAWAGTGAAIDINIFGVEANDT